jgi:transcriptional regulator with XRE-family HTH domain
MRHGIRQNELAALSGYDQTYISALEVGLKGPPTPEFVEKLISTLPLTATEADEIRAAAKASDRKLVLEPDAHPDIYWMLDTMRQRLDRLHPAQARMIRELLNLPDVVRFHEGETFQRPRRRKNLEAQM